MKKLDEKQIILKFQKSFGNKKFISEDVESFKIGKSTIIVKVDTFVESTDLPPKMNWRDAARKSIVACVSDFAAKGSTPKFGIISVNLPKTTSVKIINEISKGLQIALKEFNISILGGDTNEGKEIVIHVCIFGSSNQITRRNSAKKDHLIFVTDNFGYTSAGLEILLNKKSASRNFVKKSLRYVFRPKPKIQFGIKCKKYFSSAMDSSDGLSTTLNEMARQSKRKFVVNNIPVKKDVLEFAKKSKIDPNSLVFHGGEEYEIVFTIEKKDKMKIQKIAKLLKVPIIEIGFVTNGKGVFLENDKKFIKIKDLGWRHFR